MEMPRLKEMEYKNLLNHKTNNMKKEEVKNEENFVIEDSITYKLTVSNDGYQFENTPSIGADLAGLLISKRIHEDELRDILYLKQEGKIEAKFKSQFENRVKDLRKLLHTNDKTIKHLFKFAAQQVIKES